MPDQTQRSRGETLFLAALIIGTLLVSLGFVVATVFGAYGFPSTMVAILLGICIATLGYAFLGGLGDASFAVGAVKLAGAAAIIIIVFYLVDGPLADSMRDARLIAQGRNAEALIAEQRERAEGEIKRRRAAEKRLQELEASSDDQQTESVSAIVSRIEKSTPDDRLGKAVLELYRTGKGPFDATIQTLTLPARFNHQVAVGTFRYCPDKRPELREKPVRFELVDADAGTSQHITLRPGADIGPGLCSQIKYDVMLGCDAAVQLLPQAVSNCDARSGVAWNDPGQNKAYDLTATTLNPDLLPNGQ